jgi:hypothetical protein
MSDFLPAIIGIGAIIAWITHVVSCVAAGAYMLLIIGALFFPVGIIHGVMVWFGASWAH